MKELKSITDQFLKKLENAVSTDDENAYVNVSQIIDAITDELRESAQQMTSDNMKKIASKLKGDQPLNAAEIESLRLWIVGDAESYVNNENSVKDWKQEVRRLTDVIRGSSADDLRLEDIYRLQAFFRDLDRVVDDLAYFASQKDRVEKFNTAIQNLTREDRDILFGLMNTKLQSKYY